MLPTDWDCFVHRIRLGVYVLLRYTELVPIHKGRGTYIRESQWSNRVIKETEIFKPYKIFALIVSIDKIARSGTLFST